MVWDGADPAFLLPHGYLRRDPVGSQLRGLRGSAQSFADFSARTGAEVSTAWRTMLAADERGDLGGVIRGMGDVAANVTLVSDLQRTELGRAVLNGAVMVGAAYFTGGASVVPTLLGTGSGIVIDYGVQVVDNVVLSSLQ